MSSGKKMNKKNDKSLLQGSMIKNQKLLLRKQKKN